MNYKNTIIISLVVAASCTPGFAYQSSYIEGQKKFNHGDYLSAIKYFSKAAQLDPAALLWLAKSYKKNGNTTEAIKVYRRVLKINPNNVEVLTDLGEMLSWKTPTRPESISLLQKAVAIKPTDIELAKKLALVVSWQPETRPLAIEQLKKIVAANPSDLKNTLLLAELLGWSKNYSEAEYYYNKYLLRRPNDMDARLHYASMLSYQKSRSSDALIEFDKILAVKPTYKEALLGRTQTQLWFFSEQASIAGKKHDWAAAEKYAQQMLVLQPDSAQAKFILAGALNASGKTDEAHSVLSSLPPQYRLSAQYESAAGDIAVAGKQYGDAITHYQTALNYDPTDSNTHLSLGRAFMRMQNYGQAINQFDRVGGESEVQAKLASAECYALNGDRDTARNIILTLLNGKQAAGVDVLNIAQDMSGNEAQRVFVLELMEMASRNPDNAIDDQAILQEARFLSWNPDTRQKSILLYQKYLAIHPNDNKANEEFADVLSWTNKRKEANEIYHHLIISNQADQSVLIKQARVLSWRGKLGTANKIYKQILVSSPDNREALIGLGETESWSGDFLLAEKTFKKVAGLYPNDPQNTFDRALNFKALGRLDKAYTYALLAQQQLHQPAPTLERIR